jgi:hypothetical protein
MTRIFPGRSAVQILEGALEIFLFRDIQSSSSAHPGSNSSVFADSKVACADSLTTHNCLEPSLKISGAIPSFKLCANMAHTGTIQIYHYLLHIYISLKKSHSFWSYKGTISYITYPLHAQYMTHLFHLH